MGIEDVSIKNELVLTCTRLDPFPKILKISTPWKQLNNILEGGFLGGELIVVSGYGLSNTLSSFVRSLVLHAVESETRTLYINDKGANAALLEQFILSHVPVKRSALRNMARLSVELQRRIEKEQQRAGNFPLEICRTPAPIGRLEELAQDNRFQGKSFFVIDPVTLIYPDPLSFGDHLARLKWMATKYNVPVLVTLESLKRKEEEWSLEEFPEAILIHADKMITIKDDYLAGQILHVAVIRNRDGDLGQVVLLYDSTRSAFIEGERFIPAYINEPMNILRRVEGKEESNECFLQRVTPQFLAITEQIEKRATLRSVKNAIQFVRERVKCRTHVEAIKKLGLSTGGIASDNQKGARYKQDFINAIKSLDCCANEKIQDNQKEVQSKRDFKNAVSSMPPHQLKLVATVLDILGKQ